MQPQLEESWKEALADTFQQQYMRDLSQFLRQEKKAGHTFYPPPKLIFNALNATPLPKVRAVIIGLILRNQCPVAESVR